MLIHLLTEQRIINSKQQLMIQQAIQAENSWMRLSSAQRCFADGLAIAFSFLTLNELITVAVACKGWRVGAKRVAKLGDGQEELLNVTRTNPPAFLSTDRLSHFRSSPFQRHIRTLKDEWQLKHHPEDLIVAQHAWKLVDLRQLKELPHITRIDHMLVALTAVRFCSPILFPPYLQSIDLHFAFRSCVEGRMYALLKGLTFCSSLTDIQLTAVIEDDVEWDLTPLLEIKQLRRLMIKGWPNQYYGKAIGVIKQLSSLQHLQLLLPNDYELEEPHWCSWLAAISRAPNQLQQLTEIDLDMIYMFADQLLQLQQFPSLTVLEPII